MGNVVFMANIFEHDALFEICIIVKLKRNILTA